MARELTEEARFIFEKLLISPSNHFKVMLADVASVQKSHTGFDSVAMYHQIKNRFTKKTFFGNFKSTKNQLRFFHNVSTVFFHDFKESR